MKDKQFYFELRDNIREFTRAFNDIVISRYNKDRVEQKQLPVRFLYAPKKAFVHALNKGKNMVLPVASFNVTGYALDTTRLFNKARGLDLNSTKDNLTKAIRQPIPITMNLNMQIVAKNQLDMDQILSNFIPNVTQYFIISLGLPPEIQVSIPQELRCIVKWSGSISADYNLAPSDQDQEFHITSTDFTLETWIFPKFVESKPVYKVFLNYRDQEIENPIMEQQGSIGDPETQDIINFLNNTTEDIVQPPYMSSSPPQSQ